MTIYAPTKDKSRISYRKPELLTPEEYLCLEDRSEQKHEYINGRRYEMAGSTPSHSQITANLIILLGILIFETNFIIHTSDQRIKTARKRSPRLTTYCYPDISIADHPQKFETIDGLKALLNPLLLVEVLSVSTANEDRGRKFEHYKNIPSFREYLLVAQDAPQVEQFVRQEDGSWAQIIYKGFESSVPLNFVEGMLPLSRIYSKVEFETSE